MQNYPIPSDDKANRMPVPVVRPPMGEPPPELQGRASQLASEMLRPIGPPTMPQGAGAPPVVIPKPAEQITLDQLKSTPDYVTKFLIDLARSVLGLSNQESSQFQIPQSPGGGTPSHGYTVAEGGNPEMVTAEGAYFPYERGQVIPMEGRATGGGVEPTWPGMNWNVPSPTPLRSTRPSPMDASDRNKAGEKLGLSGYDLFNFNPNKNPEDMKRANQALGRQSPDPFRIPGLSGGGDRSYNVFIAPPTPGVFKEKTSSPVFGSDQRAAFDAREKSKMESWQKNIGAVFGGGGGGGGEIPMYSRRDGGDVEDVYGDIREDISPRPGSKTGEYDLIPRPEGYIPTAGAINRGLTPPSSSIPIPDVANIAGRLGRTALGTGEYLGRIPMYLGAKGRELAESAIGIKPISPRSPYMTSAGNIQRMEELLPGGPELPLPSLKTFGYKRTGVTDMTPGRQGVYEIPKRYGPMDEPLRIPSPSSELPEGLPDGLAKWGITRSTLPTGGTRYTLPGTEGYMDIPEGGIPKSEVDAYLANMKPGRWYGAGGVDLTSQWANERRYNEEVADAQRRQGEYDAYMRDLELRQAAGLAPRSGMTEYEARKNMEMTRLMDMTKDRNIPKSARLAAGQQLSDMRRGKAESQATALRGYMDLQGKRLEHGPGSPGSQEQLARAYNLREMPGIQRERYALDAQSRLDGIRENLAEKAGLAQDKKEQQNLQRRSKRIEAIEKLYTTKDFQNNPVTNWEAVANAVNQDIKAGRLDPEDALEIPQEAGPPKKGDIKPSTVDPNYEFVFNGSQWGKRKRK